MEHQQSVEAVAQLLRKLLNTPRDLLASQPYLVTQVESYLKEACSSFSDVPVAPSPTDRDSPIAPSPTDRDPPIAPSPTDRDSPIAPSPTDRDPSIAPSSTD